MICGKPGAYHKKLCLTPHGRCLLWLPHGVLAGKTAFSLTAADYAEREDGAVVKDRWGYGWSPDVIVERGLRVLEEMGGRAAASLYLTGVTTYSLVRSVGFPLIYLLETPDPAHPGCARVVWKGLTRDLEHGADLPALLTIHTILLASQRDAHNVGDHLPYNAPAVVWDPGVVWMAELRAAFPK
jgi:hypothetical protein